MEMPATKPDATVGADAKPIPSPLAGVYASAGARMGVWFGCALPDNFGDPAAEYRFANQTVAPELTCNSSRSFQALMLASSPITPRPRLLRREDLSLPSAKFPAAL